MIRVLNNTSPETKLFLKFIRDDLKQCRVRLQFTKAKTIRVEGIGKADGFFQEPRAAMWGRIRIATGGTRKPSTILATIAHEYCHFRQWYSSDIAYMKEYSPDHYLILEEKTEKESIALLREFRVPLNFRAVKKRSESYITRLRASQIPYKYQ